MLLRFSASVLGCALFAACAPHYAAPSPEGQPTSCVGHPAGDTTVYRVSQLTEPPRLRTGPPPEYPDTLEKLGIEGTVTLTLIVGLDGRPEPQSLQVVQSPDSGLSRSAVRWAESFSFWPGCRGDGAVRTRISVPVAYHMNRQPP
jgi:TonB family protein